MGNQTVTQELLATEANLTHAQENSRFWHSRLEQHHHTQQTTAEADEMMRTELASARENLAQMHASRLTAMRTHTHSVRILEQQEASMREAELLTARERDHYFEQLVATVPQGTPAPVQASPTPPQQVPPPPPQMVPPQVPAQQATPQVPPAQAAAGTPAMQQQCQYPNAESYFVDPATGTPVMTPQGQVPLPIHQPGTQYTSATPAVGPASGSVPWRPLGQ
eukprot:6460246-Amphidinium_carterae.1